MFLEISLTDQITESLAFGIDLSRDNWGNAYPIISPG